MPCSVMMILAFSRREVSIISICLRAWALPTKYFLSSLVDQADGFGLALGYLNHRFAFPFSALDDRQLLLFGSFELTRRQQTHGAPFLLSGLSAYAWLF